MSSALLVSAGEASDDAMAAAVLRRLVVRAFGVGSSALEAEGVELVARPSGWHGLARGPRFVRLAAELLREMDRRKPRAALLVGFSSFNRWLGPRLRRRKVRSLWLAPPLIWARRRRPSRGLATTCDKLAVLFPFETRPWHELGADVTYVGHPAIETKGGDRNELRQRLGLTPYAECVALLPGSRAPEVSRLVAPMLHAVEMLRAERGALDARVLIASSLESSARRALRALADSRGVPPIDPAPLLPTREALGAFDAALTVNGSASVECAVAEAPPVIAHKSPRLERLLARGQTRSRDVGLANLVLGRRAFTELTERSVTGELLADALSTVLDRRPQYLEHCHDVRQALTPGGLLPSERVAELLLPWLV